MRDNPVQFAVVREDPLVEVALVDRVDAKSALLVASGGCTALTLGAERPAVEVTAFDANPAQLDLVRAKLGAPREGRLEPGLWTVGVDDPESLNARGNFESLFRSLRRFLEDLALPREELLGAFEGRLPFEETVRRLVEHPYWRVAFDVHFQDELLETMFGAAAIQHAAPGSYPEHFRRAFEAGLREPSARSNRFLHHVLVGHYLDRPGARPPYLPVDISARAPAPDPDLVHGTLEDVPDLGRFDVLSLSNVTDWMAPREIEETARLLTERARSGAVLAVRMLNTPLPLADALGDAWRVESALASNLHRLDRSLFYSSLLIATKR
ncbi:MAG: DUF3419 family protein [Planctomycetota bacterium]